MRKSLSFHSSVRYFKYIVLVLLFYPLTVLGAQGHITVKGQSITIKEAIMLCSLKKTVIMSSFTMRRI